MEPLEDYDDDKPSWIESWQSWWSTLKSVTRAHIDSNEVRCPDPEFANKMRQVYYIYVENLASKGGPELNWRLHHLRHKESSGGTRRAML